MFWYKLKKNRILLAPYLVFFPRLDVARKLTRAQCIFIQEQG